MKHTLAAAALSLAAMPVMALDLDNMNEAERKAFGAAVRAYLMENPEVIYEVADAAQAAQQAKRAEMDMALVKVNAEAIFNDGFSHVSGNPEGDITLVEFIDYTCGYCRKAHSEVQALVQGDKNIRLITKELPILGDQAVILARFAIAVKTVHGGEAYETANAALISFDGEPNTTSLGRLAKVLGLDAEKIFAEMDSEATENELRETSLLAQRMQISGTPAFVLQDELLRGYLPLAAMQQIVAQKREK